MLHLNGKETQSAAHATSYVLLVVWGGVCSTKIMCVTNEQPVLALDSDYHQEGILTVLYPHGTEGPHRWCLHNQAIQPSWLDMMTHASICVPHQKWECLPCAHGTSGRDPQKIETRPIGQCSGQNRDCETKLRQIRQQNWVDNPVLAHSVVACAQGRHSLKVCTICISWPPRKRLQHAAVSHFRDRVCSISFLGLRVTP